MEALLAELLRWAIWSGHCCMRPAGPKWYAAAHAHLPTMACRALLEGWASFMWQRFSGVLLWKTQNPWAGLRGQLYDWLLAPTGGYYGVMLACEPIHVQLNLHTSQVR